MARDASDIEVRALRVFEHELPDTCVENEESQDKQHLDYTLHLREEGRPSGIQFAVQVKGVSRPKGSRRISKSFQRAHLEYWIERSRLPVFIVLVDVTKEQSYFIFAHDWARSFGDKWKDQASTTIHIPRANRVSDHPRFIQAIRDADLAMQRSAGRRAIAAYRERDARFEYDLVHLASGEEHLTIRAREPVEVHVTATGDAAAARLWEMFRTGQPQEFQPGELHFDGGPLFEHMQREAGDQAIGFQVVEERDCHVAVLVEDESGVRTRALGGLRGSLQAGSERVEYDTRARDAPLRLHGFHERANTPAGLQGSLGLSLDVGAWTGHRLPALPGIERIRQLAEALSAAKKAYLEFTIDGERIEPPQELGTEVVPKLASWGNRALEFPLAMCDAARKLGVTPKLPDLRSLSQEALEQLAALLELCRTGELAVPTRPLETELEIELVKGALLPERLRETGFRLTDPRPAELFGATSERYRVARHLGPFLLADGHEPEQVGERVRLKLKSADGAQLVYQLQPIEIPSRL